MSKQPKHTIEDLRYLQSLPLEQKVQISQTRILEWILRTDKKCFVSFSGGKDSTVLLDLVRRVDDSIPALFVNTGLEFPEIRRFANSKSNVVEICPQNTFREVLTLFGFPIISKEIAESVETARKLKTSGKIDRKKFYGKVITPYGEKSYFNAERYLQLVYLPFKISNRCCIEMKEKPAHKYARDTKCFPFLGTMAEESKRRESGWVKVGCNAFDIKQPRSAPLSFWKEQDILKYIKQYSIEICSVYGEIVYTSSKTRTGCAQNCLKCSGRQRTGCIFCLFGAHHKQFGRTRFQDLAFTHPKLYDYCMRGGEWIDNPDYDPAAPLYVEQEDIKWLNWNPKKIWVPNKKGLGYKVMLDMVNSVYGKDFIPYD